MKIELFNTFFNSLVLAAEQGETSLGLSQYFKTDQLWFFLIMIFVSASIMYYIHQARLGKELNIRKIAGLEAVEEAVGRATEMGRNTLFIPGILDI